MTPPDSVGTSVQPRIKEFLDSEGALNVQVRDSIESASYSKIFDSNSVTGHKDQTDIRPGSRKSKQRVSIDSTPKRNVPLYQYMELKQKRREETAL